MNATETVVDALAVARLTRLWQHDEVWPMPEARALYLRKVGDSRWADLESCPWCASAHFAILVGIARRMFPKAWPIVARVLAGSQVTGMLAEMNA